MIENKKVSSNFKITVIFFILFFVVSLYGFATLYDESYLSNDGAQYLSVVKNFLDGKGFSTSILYYDAHYRLGTMPVPQTVFPPGYPFLAGLISMLGISPRYALSLLSFICLNLIPIILYQILRLSGHKQGTCLILSCVWFPFVIVWLGVFAGMTEMSYILCTLISLRCIIQSERNMRKVWILLSGAFAALAFTIRYAGIFYIISLILFFFLHFLRQKSKRSFCDLVVVSILPLFSLITLFTRNYLLVSNLRGSDFYMHGNSIIGLLHRYYYALSGIFGFSKIGIINARIPELLLIVFSLSILVFVFIRLKTIRVNKAVLRNIFIKTSTSFSLIYLFINIILLTLAGAIGQRYLMPLIPFILILLADLLRVPYFEERFGKNVLSLFYLGLLVLFLSGQSNVLLYHRQNLTDTNEYVYRKIRYGLQHSFHSSTLHEFLDKEVTLNSPVIGNEPQILGAVLDRPVVGLGPSWYTNRIWSFNDVKKTMIKYNIRLVVFFPELIGKGNLFFQELRKGNIPPWLEVVFSSEEVSLFQVKLPGERSRPF